MNIEDVNEFQKKFLEEFNNAFNQDLLKSVNVKTQYNNNEKELEITLQHHVSGKYNILIYVKDGIVVFFNVFHTHFENYTEEKSEKELIEESIEYIKELLSAKEIIITKFYKGKREFKSKMDIINRNGDRLPSAVLSNGFGGLLFFIRTKEIILKTTF